MPNSIGVEQIPFYENMHLGPYDKGPITDEVFAFLKKHKEANIYDALHKKPDARCFFIQATVKGKIVGCLLANLDTLEGQLACHVKGFPVRPTRDNQHIRNQLFSALKRASLSRNVPRIVAPKNIGKDSYNKFLANHDFIPLNEELTTLHIN